MLAILGFATIIITLALVMSKKVSTLVALIAVPTITGLIAAIREAGGAGFLEALNILSSKYMGAGLTSIVSTGVMFIFAILFFSTASDAGVFDPIISRILKFTGEDPVKICIGTFLIGCLIHLDGSGAATFLIAIPACMPMFKKMKMNIWVEATIIALAAGIMNVVPWGGPTIRAASAMTGMGIDVTASQLWVSIMPAWIIGILGCLGVAILLGRKEKKRLLAGIPAEDVSGTAASQEENDPSLERKGWHWFFNLGLIILVLAVLILGWMSPAVTFMIGYAILLTVNYPSGTIQNNIINKHAKAAFLMVSIVFAAGVFTGVVKNSGMLDAMTGALVSIVPKTMGKIIAPVVGVFSVPLSLLFDPDSYYFGVMPVLANTVMAMGGDALAVAKASIMGQMTLGFPLSPLTGATFLLLGLSGQDLGDHQKHTLPWAWAVSVIMVIIGCIACGLLK